MSGNQANAALNQDTFRARLEQSTDLPSPVGVAVRILELGQNPDVNLNEVAKVIGLDPALTTKLLRMANSPLYARHRKTENIRQAITLFGVEGTITLALSFSVVSNVQDKSRRRTFDYDSFWRRSLAAATCAQVIGEQLEINNKEDLFLGGLLQDIGMLAIEKSIPDFYTGIASALSGHRNLIDCERAKMGCDHAEIGAWLLQRWNFPEKLRQVVCASHDPASLAPVSASIRQQVSVVALSSDMADLICCANSKDVIDAVMQRAYRLLGMDHETFFRTLETTAQALRDIAHLFDIKIDDRIYVDGLLNEARELILLRNINVMQRSLSLAKDAELLEDRTRKLEEVNRRDVLTGLFNRGYLDHVLSEEIIMANRHGWPFTVMFIDLDNFKRINDEHGHHVGDQVIKNAAKIMMDYTRGSDIVARYGGEEFIVVLPGVGNANAAVTSSRLLEAFRKNHLSVDGLDLHITVSIGAAVHGEDRVYTNLDEILKAADEALYVAKRQGRDRCVFYVQAATSD